MSWSSRNKTDKQRSEKGSEELETQVFYDYHLSTETLRLSITMDENIIVESRNRTEKFQHAYSGS